MSPLISKGNGETSRAIPFTIITSSHLSASSFTSLPIKTSPSKLVDSIREVESIDDEKAEGMKHSAVLSTDNIEKMSNTLSELCISDSITFQASAMNKLMDEILIASKILTGRYYEIVGSRGNEVVCATKLLYFGIQRVLKSCQSFSHFRDLSCGDQEMLIKGSCTEMLLIRSLYHVNLELDAWIFHSPSTVRIGA